MNAADFYDQYAPLRPFLSVWVFIIGACIGSFLNVVIWRVPRGESIVTAPSHCPHCNYKIRWYENVPLLAWLLLAGKCRNCRAPISSRYIIVETITGLLFLLVWWQAWPDAAARGGNGQPLAQLMAFFILTAILVAVTYIDIDHMIIPDGLNLFGLVVAVAFAAVAPASHELTTVPHQIGNIRHMSMLLVSFVSMMQTGIPSILAYIGAPGLLDGLPSILESTRALALLDVFLGVIFGGGILWLLSEGGKLFFGNRRIRCIEPCVMTLNAQGFKTSDGDEDSWEELFLRETDEMVVTGRITCIQWRRGKGLRVEPVIDLDREDSEIRIDEHYMHFGEDAVALEHIKDVQITTSEWVEPREVMGGGDVKLLAVLGAFLGPSAALFILCLSSLLGTVGGLLLMFIGGTKLYTRIPFGPYIAGAAMVYMLFGDVIITRYAIYFARIYGVA